MASAVLGSPVTNDIRVRKFGRFDISIICSSGDPSSYWKATWILINVSFVIVLACERIQRTTDPTEGRGIIASISYAVGYNPVDMAVSSDLCH